MSMLPVIYYSLSQSPSNQPISGLLIFSKRQALSRAVVVNSNVSRGKYLAREGPGSRLRTPMLAVIFSSYGNGTRLDRFIPVSTALLKKKTARRDGMHACIHAGAFVDRRCRVDQLHRSTFLSSSVVSAFFVV